MTQGEQKKIENDFGWAISKLISKSIRVISETYDDIVLIDLLMALPVRPMFEEIDLSKMQKADGTQLTQQDTAIGGYITRDTEQGNPNRMIVHLVFSKDINVTWDDFFAELISTRSKAYQAMVSFVYLHEAMHILMRHYDYYLNRNYYDIIDEFRSELPESEKDELLNHAFDYWINGYLIEQAKDRSTIREFENNSNFSGLYDKNLSPGVLEQQEIVIKLAKEAKIEKRELLDNNGNMWGTATTITINGNSSTTINVDGQHQLDSADPSDTSSNLQDITDVMEGTRRNLLNNTKGSGSQGAFHKLGVEYAVPIDWFDHLKSSLFTLTQKYTSQYDQTWSKLKSKMRHVAPMPGRIHYEKEMAAVISIDQSGSMSDSDLEKINYVVTSLAKKSVFVEVLLHDHRVASRQRFEGKKFQGIREFITNRVACGGTSHQEVFEVLREIKEEKKTRKIIYLSFSDNYSDIEQVYDSALFDKIPAYWIVTQGGKPVNVPGMQISLDSGLLQN